MILQSGRGMPLTLVPCAYNIVQVHQSDASSQHAILNLAPYYVLHLRCTARRFAGGMDRFWMSSDAAAKSSKTADLCINWWMGLVSCASEYVHTPV
eukprot:scaffold96705_cov17-Tisochrysis_lutea.AAC.1